MGIPLMRSTFGSTFTSKNLCEPPSVRKFIYCGPAAVSLMRWYRLCVPTILSRKLLHLEKSLTSIASIVSDSASAPSDTCLLRQYEERATDRVTERQTDRMTNRQTNRERDKEIERQTDRRTNIQTPTDTQIHRQTNKLMASPSYYCHISYYLNWH